MLFFGFALEFHKLCIVRCMMCDVCAVKHHTQQSRVSVNLSNQSVQKKNTQIAKYQIVEKPMQSLFFLP